MSAPGRADAGGVVRRAGRQTAGAGHRLHEHGAAADEGQRRSDAQGDQGGLPGAARETAAVPAAHRRVQRQADLRGVQRQEGVQFRAAAGLRGRHEYGECDGKCDELNMN